MDYTSLVPRPCALGTRLDLLVSWLPRWLSWQYSSMEELMANVDLMVQNACTFNEEESQVYNVSGWSVVFTTSIVCTLHTHPHPHTHPKHTHLTHAHTHTFTPSPTQTPSPSHPHPHKHPHPHTLTHTNTLTPTHTLPPHTHSHPHPHKQDALVLQEVAKEANNRLQQGWTATSPSTTIKPAPRGRPPKGRTASLSAQLSSALNGTPAAAQSVGKGRPTPIVSLFDAVKFCVVSNLLNCL